MVLCVIRLNLGCHLCVRKIIIFRYCSLWNMGPWVAFSINHYCLKNYPSILKVYYHLFYSLSIFIEAYFVVLYQGTLRSPRWSCQLWFFFSCIRSCSVAINCISHDYPILNPCWSMVNIYCSSLSGLICVCILHVPWLCSIYKWVILACNFLPSLYSLSWKLGLCLPYASLQVMCLYSMTSWVWLWVLGLVQSLFLWKFRQECHLVQMPCLFKARHETWKLYFLLLGVIIHNLLGLPEWKWFYIFFYSKNPRWLPKSKMAAKVWENCARTESAAQHLIFVIYMSN